jgi:hypothetical protein
MTQIRFKAVLQLVEFAHAYGLPGKPSNDRFSWII